MADVGCSRDSLRICDIRYEGDGCWSVVRSEGTRLTAGDTFRCPSIIAGEPLYLDDVHHPGCKPGVYVCGRRNGISFILL